MARKIFGWFFGLAAFALFLQTNWPIPEAVSPLENWLMNRGLADSAALMMEFFLLIVLAVISGLLLVRPRQGTISWDELLRQGIHDWELHGVEAGSFFNWRGRVHGARREREDITFELLDLEGSYLNGQEWRPWKPTARSITLSATRLHAVEGGWEFEVTDEGTYLLKPGHVA